MPKCRQCEYLVKEKGEYGDEYCAIFGYDTPEKYVAWEGEGCRCTSKQLDRMFKRNIEIERQYYEQENQYFEEFMRKEEPYLYD